MSGDGLGRLADHSQQADNQVLGVAEASSGLPCLLPQEQDLSWRRLLDAPSFRLFRGEQVGGGDTDMGATWLTEEGQAPFSEGQSPRQLTGLDI